MEKCAHINSKRKIHAQAPTVLLTSSYSNGSRKPLTHMWGYNATSYAKDTVYGNIALWRPGSHSKLVINKKRIHCSIYVQTGQEEKKVEKYLSKELFQKTEENFQQTQKLQDLGNKRKQWQDGLSKQSAIEKGIK